LRALNSLLAHWFKDHQFKNLKENLQEGNFKNGLITGLEGTQKDFLIAAISKYTDYNRLLIVVPHLERAEEMQENLSTFLPEEKILLIPPRDMIFNEEIVARNREVTEPAFTALEGLAASQKQKLIIPVQTLLQRMMPPEVWKKSIKELYPGTIMGRDDFLAILVSLGYQRAELVESKGQFSVRGYIVDLFPVGREYPVRMEFFDDQVESIREFDAATQRSRNFLPALKVLPASEVVLEEPVRQTGINKIQEELAETVSRLHERGQKNLAQKLQQKVNKHLHALDGPVLNEGLWAYFPFYYGKGATWLDYLEKNSLVLFDEFKKTKNAASNYFLSWKDIRREFILQGEILPGEIDFTWEFEEVVSRLNHPVLYLNSFTSRESKAGIDFSCKIEGKDVPSFYGQSHLIKEEVCQWKNSGYSVYFLAETPEKGKQLIKNLQQMEIPVIDGLEHKNDITCLSTPAVIQGKLKKGLVITSLKTVFITEKDILPHKKAKSLARKKQEGTSIKKVDELKPGDYVVHEHQGVGEYQGIQTLEVNRKQKDYLHIRYAGGDKLYLPVEQIHLIQKYVGVEGKRPRLHRLGSGEWNKVKKKVKKSVEELARELLSIYKARKNIEGHAFSSDHPWQKEFEAQFPYEETPDQLKAINEVKADMEKNYPMDRLVCGDVGYGKTEIALRAAFKAVMDGKQVAVLVPTTILAHQHYQNFLERFNSFPVRVGLLSRFLGQQEQKKVIQGLKKGHIDIIIGTHRLLSKDLNFNDLGLVIIDEEHRFGVRHKEKLKKLRLDIDVLTMTATPIPRTLHMSLAGSRDLSVIETPPENRYPVQTYVVEYNDQLMKENISREINRGGQVYFVYNRVEHIHKWGQKIQEMVPDARVAVAHGQLSEKNLEEIMNEFLEGNYDILVSTTIIEAGLDIPNVNTIMIYDADKFGLAQLYQLRGRVGRTNRVAYAYLTYRPEKVLNEEAEKRLQAIKEFAELGSGYKIALRDLEIRGAGNLLGPEQHGFMVQVGFDLYCKLLEEAVDKVKGEEKPQVPLKPRIDLGVSAFIPSTFISSQSHKIKIYQRINEIERFSEIDEIREELKDLYGPVPREAENLLRVARLNVFAMHLNVESIQQQNRRITVNFHSEPPFQREVFGKLINGFPGKISYSISNQVKLEIKLSSYEDVLDEVNKLLNQLWEKAHEKGVS